MGKMRLTACLLAAIIFVIAESYPIDVPESYYDGKRLGQLGLPQVKSTAAGRAALKKILDRAHQLEVEQGGQFYPDENMSLDDDTDEVSDQDKILAGHLEENIHPDAGRNVYLDKRPGQYPNPDRDLNRGKILSKDPHQPRNLIRGKYLDSDKDSHQQRNLSRGKYPNSDKDPKPHRASYLDEEADDESEEELGANLSAALQNRADIRKMLEKNFGETGSIGIIAPDAEVNLSRCQHRTFCEDVPNYPDRVVNDILQANEHLQLLETIDKLDSVGIAGRITSDDPLCMTRDRLVRPKIARDTEDNWRYVVNTESFTQAIKVQICRHEDRPCKIIDGTMDGYITMCKQKYVFRQLIAIKEYEVIAPEVFQIPSSCCCHINWLSHAAHRMGVVRKNGMSPRSSVEPR